MAQWQGKFFIGYGNPGRRFDSVLPIVPYRRGHPAFSTSLETG